MSRPFSLFLAGSLFLALLAFQPASAGTKAAPEVNDPAGDVAYGGAGGAQVKQIDDTNPLFFATVVESVDLLQAWTDGETDSSVAFHLRLNGGGFNPCPGIVGGPVSWTFTAQANNKTVTQAFSAPLDTNPANAITTFTCGVFTVGAGPAKNVTVSTDDQQLNFEVPRSAFGNASAGQPLTFKWASSGNVVASPTAPVAVLTDAAPNGGGFSATPFVFTMDTAVPSNCVFKAGETNKTDSDRDCLPDSWEKQHFTNVTAQNATGDPDADGCNNRCEYLAGTDPNVANASCVFKTGETNKTDSDADCLPDYWEKQYFGNATAANATGDPDGDKCDNRCEYLAGTDPNKSNLSTGTGTPNTNTGTKVVTTPSSTGSGTSAPASDKEPSALDKIKADAGYAVASSAAMSAVVLISLVGLFGRWGA
ncbi:MAG TPA: hypothetical protein VM286_03985 [Candidatus Thermoplasmatota archaeon]|nr:hypothetical protein [Candidatus Thermoplasmatota archaeon]